MKKFDDILSNKPEDLKEYHPSKDCGKNSQSISCKNITVVIEAGWGGGRFRQNHFLLALIAVMMFSISRAGDYWIRWPSRELLPIGRCCYGNKCHESTATDLSSNLQTLTMVNH